MKKFLIFAALALTALAALAVTGFAYAQSATPTPAQPVTQAWKGKGPGGVPGMRGVDLRSYEETALAEAFGVSVADLQSMRDEGKSLTDLAIEQNLSVAEFDARIQAAHTSALEKAVADGALTQEQADAMAAFKDERPEGPRRDGDHPLQSYMDAAVAEAFGISAEELQTLQADGKTLKDLAIEQNLSVAEFQSRQEAAKASALESAVAAGAITQAQADAIAAREGRGGPEGFGGHGGPGGPGGPGRRGGFEGPGGRNCNQAPADSSSSTATP